ncbi:hypothetical protein CC1G_00780 [Coprinopsis cinerea okayama7|uniref:Transmembrane protein n=1 Tax=Coprinopsis cinerea (strain Okayama-7 / 130 / ATCC MYA-4618 / FGSC 9003) TaxID=240176 RepID=A8N8Q5_COPC7|nr:hypothetical protein CC1G_00780 [Coprinopsis cinerea okayama7\|eukprot:XP_001831233.2 hypothetical protein CC1G_00780 [Coprinopsis cinerea okayama7\
MAFNASSNQPRPRRILVDDVDRSILYNGPWFTDHDSHNELGNFGPPLERTLHGVPPEASASFVFEYEGAGFDVWGTVRNNFDATWECIVDGENIGRSGFRVSEQSANRHKLCEWQSNSFGHHTLMVNATSGRDTFLFDFIRYVPSPSRPPPRATTLTEIPNEDPVISYDGHWMVIPGFAHLTRVAQSSATISFDGTSLEWYGYTPDEFPIAPSVAEFSVDGAPPITFILPGLERGRDPAQYNQLLFATGPLRQGPHTVVVTHHGSQAPLTLNYLIIKEEFVPPSFTTSSPATESAVPQENLSNPPSPGTIAGAVIGSICAVSLIVLAAFFYLRRRHKSELPMIQPLPGFVKPEASAPLDIDIVSSRLSDDMGPSSRPGSFPAIAAHARRRSTARRFNPEVRSTISSVNLNPPPVQHAPPSTTNTGDVDSIVEVPRPVASSSDVANSQLNPYESGYPYGAMQLADYQRLVEATKDQEARANARARDSYM